MTIVLLLAAGTGITAVSQMRDGIHHFAIEKAKGDLNLVYRYIDHVYPGEWRVEDGTLLKGSTVFNENYELVDAIGNETGDTITIFLGDTRIATNVTIDGKRVVGTQVSQEVASTVLKKGEKYFGEADVAGNTYQTAYMPIKNSSEEIIGILYVGAPQEIIKETISSFLMVFLIVLVTVILVSVLVVYLFSRKLKKRLNHIAAALQEAGKGDFTKEVMDETGDELSDLSKSYNEMKRNLSEMIRSVITESDQVLTSSEQLMASSQETAAATNEK